MSPMVVTWKDKIHLDLFLLVRLLKKREKPHRVKLTPHYSIWWCACVSRIPVSRCRQTGKTCGSQTPTNQASVPETVPSLANIPLPL